MCLLWQVVKKVVAVVGIVTLTSITTVGALKVLDNNDTLKKVAKSSLKTSDEESDIKSYETDNEADNKSEKRKLNTSAYSLESGRLYKFLKDNKLESLKLIDKAYILQQQANTIGKAFQEWENRDNIMKNFMDCGDVRIEYTENDDLQGLEQLCNKYGYNNTEVKNIIEELQAFDYNKVQKRYDQYVLRCEQEEMRKNNFGNTYNANEGQYNNNRISKEQKDYNMKVAEDRYDKIAQEEKMNDYGNNYDNLTTEQQEEYNAYMNKTYNGIE